MSTNTYTSKTRDYKAQFQKKAETAARRAATMDVKVFRLKICENKLTKTQSEFLFKIFLECKWYYNSCVAFGLIEGNKPWNNDYKKTTVIHYDKDKNPIESEFVHITAAARQEINKRIGSNCKTIKTLKQRNVITHSKGLRFKSECNSVPFRQYGLQGWCLRGTKIKLAKCRKPFPVYGLEQLQIPGIEFANANLVQKATGYYLYITAYVPKQIRQTNGQIVGIDFGCKTSFTIYNEQTKQSQKLDIGFEQSEKAKKLQRKLQRRLNKGFSNKTNKGLRLTKLYRKQLEKRNNKKDDVANKLVHQLKQYDCVVFQDEMLMRWQSHSHGKKIDTGILGRVKKSLQHMSTAYQIDKAFPTSRFCFKCYHVHKTLTPWDRTYICPYCGLTEDRDIHAAQNMIAFYHMIEMVPMEHRDPEKVIKLMTNIEKRVEMSPSVSLQEIILSEIQGLSTKHETTKRSGSSGVLATIVNEANRQ